MVALTCFLGLTCATLAVMTQPQRKKTFILIQVGDILRDARERAGISGPQVVRAELVTNVSLLSRLEAGFGTSLTARQIGDLCDFYRMPQDERFMVQQMYRTAKEHDDPEWMESFSQVMFRGISLLFTLERKAKRVRMYDVLVHGLFQTRSYAWMLHRGDEAAVAEQKIELRMKRQREFWKNLNRDVKLLIPEHALLGDCPQDQLDHLGELDQLPNVAIRYVPASHGPRPNLPGKFSVIEFDGASPNVVYSESVSAARYEHSPFAVKTHLATFDSEMTEGIPIKEFRRE